MAGSGAVDFHAQAGATEDFIRVLEATFDGPILCRACCCVRVRRRAAIADCHHTARVVERFTRLREGRAAVVRLCDVRTVTDDGTVCEECHALVSTDHLVAEADIPVGNRASVLVSGEHTDADRFRLRIELGRDGIVRGADVRRGLGVEAHFTSSVFGGLRLGCGCHEKNRRDCECAKERCLACVMQLHVFDPRFGGKNHYKIMMILAPKPKY